MANPMYINGTSFDSRKKIKGNFKIGNCCVITSNHKKFLYVFAFLDIICLLLSWKELLDIPGLAMVVDDITFSIQLLQGSDDHKHKWNQLDRDEPDINRSDVGHWRQLVHNTKFWVLDK